MKSILVFFGWLFLLGFPIITLFAAFEMMGGAGIVVWAVVGFALYKAVTE